MFSRTKQLIGSDFQKLADCNIIIFGIGGVGGYTAEMLIRSGVGRLTIVDYDVVDVTNKNRQIIALNSTIGKYKVDVMADRLKDINPDALIVKVCFVTCCMTSVCFVLGMCLRLVTGSPGAFNLQFYASFCS